MRPVASEQLQVTAGELNYRTELNHCPGELNWCTEPNYHSFEQQMPLQAFMHTPEVAFPSQFVYYHCFEQQMPLGDMQGSGQVPRLPPPPPSLPPQLLFEFEYLHEAPPAPAHLPETPAPAHLHQNPDTVSRSPTPLTTPNCGTMVCETSPSTTDAVLSSLGEKFHEAAAISLQKPSLMSAAWQSQNHQPGQDLHVKQVVQLDRLLAFNGLDSCDAPVMPEAPAVSKAPLPRRGSPDTSVSKASLPRLGSPDVPSVGSLGHHLYRCKPCAFVQRTGCSNGVQCNFCHLCEPGEKKRRRKEKRALVGAARKLTDSVEQALIPSS